MKSLFCFGVGFSARAIAERLKSEGWHVAGTARSVEKCRLLESEGFTMVPFAGDRREEQVAEHVRSATHILVSVPPGELGDPVLKNHRDDLKDARNIEWIGYLSTVGVYGDHNGAWVDETTRPAPVSQRSQRRVEAEQAWRDLATESGKPLGVFRLSGIYGPGRNALVNLRRGRARRVIKPDQVFNRIHVGDIAISVLASIASPRMDAIYNVTDDEPAPPQDVIAHAAELLGMPRPPDIAFEDADLSPMGRSFYGENKRVSNALIKSELGIALTYPSYREGLAALLESERG